MSVKKTFTLIAAMAAMMGMNTDTVYSDTTNRARDRRKKNIKTCGECPFKNTSKCKMTNVRDNAPACSLGKGNTGYY